MKIAFLTPEYPMPGRCEGGLANYTRKMARILSERGCSVWVFVISARDSQWMDGSVTVCEVKRSRVNHNSLQNISYLNIFPLALSQFLNSARVRSCFWREHRKAPFDIIHASSYKAPGFCLLRNSRVPVICRVSSYTPVVRSAFGFQRGLREYLSDWLEVRQVADAEAAFAPSRFAARCFETFEGLKLDVIPTPPEPPVESDSSYFDAHRPPGSFLLFFGTLSRIKGADLLADALPPVFEKYPDISCVFIGRDDCLPGGQKVFSYINERCPWLDGRLFYHPVLEKSQLFPFIANSEAVLIPSRVDNCPNACLEAQMLGKVVIGTRDSSLDEMIVEGETGFIAENGDPPSLRDAIDRCLALSKEEKETMRQKVLEHSRKMTAEDRAGLLLAFYREAIGRFRTVA